MKKLKKFGFFRNKKQNAKLELLELKRDIPHDMEQNILHYLKGGVVIAVIVGIDEDFLAPQQTRIGLPPIVRTDGTWAWTSDVVYYVEKYHIQLPDDFLTHMARNNWQCPRVANTNNLELDYFMN